MIIVQEHSSAKYVPRTYFNAKSGDATVAFAVNMNTAGEKLTRKAAGDKYIGFILNEETSTLEVATKLYEFMKQKNAKTLNIAGNGIFSLSKHGLDQEYINKFVCDVIGIVHKQWKIEKIFTGGQTGADLAGAIVSKYLKIDALITLPKGYIQRFEDKVDKIQTKEDIEAQIDYWYDKLIKLDDSLKQNLKKHDRKK